jgi:hypothetical protein
MKVLKNIILGTFLSCASFAASAEKVTLDVLFLYSQGVTDLYNGDPSTRINHLIETTNTIFSDSQLDIEVRPVDVIQHNINDQVSPRELMTTAKDDASIQELREAYGADVVMLYRPYQQNQPCGLSYRPMSINNSTWRGLSFASVDCAGYVTAHELGHSMGLAHSHAQDSTALLPYAMGHGVQGKFATVMAYGDSYNAPKIYKFSSPKLDCNGSACGIAEGHALQADAVKALKQTAPIAAAIQASKTEAVCSVEDANLLKTIENSFLAQQSKVEIIETKLASLETDLALANAEYDAALAAYRNTIYQDYYPAYQAYIAAKTALQTQLDNYRNGTESRTTVIAMYQTYLAKRGSFNKAVTAVRTIFNDQYQPAMTALNTTRESLDAYQGTLKTEESKLANLETEYQEAVTIYQCNA